MKAQFLIALAALALIVGAQACVDVHAAPAIIVVDHGFAKDYKFARNGNVILINRTSTFTQDDIRVTAYVLATFYSANMTWNWYDPAGDLYAGSSWVAQCTTSPCSEVTYLQVRDSRAAAQPGIWRLDFLDDGVLIYSDYFSLLTVTTQYNYWNFTVVEAVTPSIHGSLRVVIYPNNRTWSSYTMYMPYATNITAYDYSTNQSLQVSDSNNPVTVGFGAPKSAGYAFVMKFDMSYVLWALNPGNFVLSWREYPYERLYDVHPVPEAFEVHLPQGVTLLDITGYNAINLNYSARIGREFSLNVFSNVTNTWEPFGWTILYRDQSQLSTYGSSNGPSGLSPLAGPLLPILPLTLGGLTAWAAVMSVFLLTASELVSPIYSRSGYGILINRRRLRLAALLLVALFMVCVAYQFVWLHPPVPR